MADLQIRKRNGKDSGGLHDWTQGTAASCHTCRLQLKSLMKTIILHTLPNTICFVVLQLGTLV